MTATLTAPSHPAPASAFHTRAAAFLLACTLYAIAGSPTPDNPGIVEAAIALLLIYSIPPIALRQTIDIHKGRPAHIIAAQALLFIIAPIGIVIAIIKNAAIMPIMRDLIPFLFMLLPLFITQTNAQSKDLIIKCALIIGIGFAARSLGVITPHTIASSLSQGLIATSNTGELLYLANMPTVLFSAIYLSAKAAEKILNALSPSSLLKASSYAALAAIPILALFISLQRASIGAWGLALFLLLAFALIKSPIRALRLAIPLALITITILPFAQFAADIIIEKTRNVGINMRGQEFAAVWNTIASNPLSILFGHGWGAAFASPAVGNIEITFTHSLISSMILKTGLIGLCVTLIYISTCFKHLRQSFTQTPIITLAILAPILIDLLLYASFKSFDFGLLLCLFVAHVQTLDKGQSINTTLAEKAPL